MIAYRLTMNTVAMPRADEATVYLVHHKEDETKTKQAVRIDQVTRADNGWDSRCDFTLAEPIRQPDEIQVQDVPNMYYSPISWDLDQVEANKDS